MHGDNSEIKDNSCPPIAKFHTEKKKKVGAREVNIDQEIYAIMVYDFGFNG